MQYRGNNLAGDKRRVPFLVRESASAVRMLRPQCVPRVPRRGCGGGRHVRRRISRRSIRRARYPSPVREATANQYRSGARSPILIMGATRRSTYPRVSRSRRLAIRTRVGKKNGGEAVKSGGWPAKRRGATAAALPVPLLSHRSDTQADANPPDPNIRTPRRRPLLKPRGMRGSSRSFVIHLLETSSTKGASGAVAESPSTGIRFFFQPQILRFSRSARRQWSARLEIFLFYDRTKFELSPSVY